MSYTRAVKWEIELEIKNVTFYPFNLHYGWLVFENGSLGYSRTGIESVTNSVQATQLAMQQMPHYIIKSNLDATIFCTLKHILVDNDSAAKLVKIAQCKFCFRVDFPFYNMKNREL